MRATELGFKRIAGVGEASLFKGDPRLPETDIDAWYQGILTEIKGASSRPYLWGSDAGLCARRNVLLEHNSWIASEKSAASAAYMAIGVALENLLAEGLHRNGKLLAQSFPLVQMPELKISGKIDLVVYDQSDELALIEVKSCGKLPTEPNPVHLAQIQTYAAVSGIQKAWLTYISRNVRDEYGPKLALRSFRVDTSPVVLISRLQTASLSRFASNAHVLPPVPAHFRKHTECHYCEFRDSFCWKPRPGLGGEEPVAPLHEIDPHELIVLDERAKSLATQLYNNYLYRKMQSIQELSHLKQTPKNKKRLAKLLQDTKQEILS